jgi:hypothetical protein
MLQTREIVPVPTEMWKTIRKELGITGAGKGKCLDWCVLAMYELQKEGHAGFYGRIAGYQAFGPMKHAWLERIEPQGLFVADGTAGQFDTKYQQGFYGNLVSVSAKLRKVYDDKAWFTMDNLKQWPTRDLPARLRKLCED